MKLKFKYFTSLNFKIKETSHLPPHFKFYSTLYRIKIYSKDYNHLVKKLKFYVANERKKTK